MEERIKGSNLHGNKNEELIVKYLDEKNYKDLNINMKNFIKFISEDSKTELTNNSKIKAYYVKDGKVKQDIIIEFSERKFFISIKMGKGNSVHQEKIDDFINFLDENFVVNNELKNAFRLAIWVDGSLDGKGSPKDRFSISQLKNKYPQEVDLIRNFLSQHEKQLISHFIVTGRHNSQVDYVYHGTIENGAWISVEQLIEYNMKNAIKNNKKTPALPIGRMSIQPWNSALNGNPKLEGRRGQLQVKYTKMEKDFDEIHIANTLNKGTYAGDKEEFNISQTFNKNKKHKFWSIMNLKECNENLYVVKVSKKVKSRLSNKKVLPKADAYVVETKLSKDYLLQREYNLTEDNLNTIDHNIIKNTGISVKRADSKKYTIAKFTLNTFENLLKDFDNVRILSLGVFLSVKDLDKNSAIIKGMNLSVDQIESILNDYKIIDNKLNLKDYDQIKSVKKSLTNIIRNIVDNNLDIKKAIFNGISLYEEPYPAHYIFKNGQLTNDLFTDYSISRGSGLSKGKYYIIFKPKG